MPLQRAKFKHLSPTTTAIHNFSQGVRPTLKPSVEISPPIFPNVECLLGRFQNKNEHNESLSGKCVCVCVCVCV